ncbi:MAG TPA: hypothetical protein VFQ27_13315 [Xanthobacteraceae bacterium]|nr:hypothetical protein [Xanthobacteraceae bacterium]
MRKMSFALALLASVSMTFIPVAPSYAAAPARASSANELVVKHAAKGNLAVLSQAQMNALARTHPSLHARLAKAAANGTVPKLSKAERRLLNNLTAQNMDDIKAGVNGWVVVAIVAGALFVLFFLTPIGCAILPFMPFCAPPPPVMARG